MKTIHLHQFISCEDQGKYLLVPFEMPERIEKVDIHYDYQSHQEEIQSLDMGQFLAIEKINTVDIGLIAQMANRLAPVVRVIARFLSPRPLRPLAINPPT